jgi:hypothetical protein
VPQIIPLTNSPDQSLTVTLTVDGAVLTLQLIVRFSEMAGYWLLTVLDRLGNLLLDSIPMITGEWPAANLLGQYAYLKIGSAYVINAGNVATDYPDTTNLGGDFVLLWDDTPAF